MDPHTHTHTRQTDKLTCTVRRPEGHLEVHSEAQLVSSEHPQSLDSSSARSHSEGPITDLKSVCASVKRDCCSHLAVRENKFPKCSWKRVWNRCHLVWNQPHFYPLESRVCVWVCAVGHCDYCKDTKCNWKIASICWQRKKIKEDKLKRLQG